MVNDKFLNFHINTLTLHPSFSYRDKASNKKAHGNCARNHHNSNSINGSAIRPGNSTSNWLNQPNKNQQSQNNRKMSH